MTDISKNKTFGVGDPVFFRYQIDSAMWSALIKELDEINNTAVIELDGIIVCPPNFKDKDPFTRNLLLTRKYQVYISDLIYRLEEPGDDGQRLAFINKIKLMKEANGKNPT